jgi:magnesium chelatase family protein
VRYRSRVSGPLPDRPDLHVEVPALRFEELASGDAAEPIPVVLGRVTLTRARQLARWVKPASHLHAAELRRFVRLEPAARDLLEHAVDGRGLSDRAHERVLELALTMEPMAAAATGGTQPRKDEVIWLARDAVAEALSYRLLDRPSCPSTTARACHCGPWRTEW